MADENFWKNAYESFWEKSSQKEKLLRDIIFEKTSFELEPYGLGAESTEFIPGSAKKHSNELGAPDFKVNGINVFVEVTGPLSNKARPESGLWIRPDKLNYAFTHRKKQEEFFVLLFDSVNKWYVIHANEEFFQDVKQKQKFFEQNDYIKIYPIIRGNKECYISINHDNPFVKDLDYFISYLKKIK